MKLPKFANKTQGIFTYLLILLAVIIPWNIPLLPSQAVPISAAVATNNNFVTAAVNRVGPAVVLIETERTITRRSPDPFFDDPFFRRFFDDEMMPRSPQREIVRGEGSGFIIDKSGIILTNAHVVDKADKVKITLKDGRNLTGQVQGIDEITDLAVVKVNAKGVNLPVAPLGDSSQIQVGDWAIAVGNPFGLNNTVTLGIISTLNRSSAQVGIPDKRLDFIQTDAAINPGNSGGPLLNDKGEVIGINTAIRANATGIGFAIPINTAKAIQDKLIKGEKIAHPYIGVQIANLTPSLAQENNKDPNTSFILPEINGVLVVRVIPDTPAAIAGLRSGDVITEINGNSVTSADRLQSIVEESKLGQTLQLKLIRSDRTLTIPVQTAELQKE